MLNNECHRRGACGKGRRSGGVRERKEIGRSVREDVRERNEIGRELTELDACGSFAIYHTVTIYIFR